MTLSPITNVQVERERRRLKRYHSGRSLPDACGFLLSDQHKMAASRQVRTESSLVGGGSGHTEEQWQIPVAASPQYRPKRSGT